MLRKLANVKKIMLLLCLAGAVALVGAIPVGANRFGNGVAQAADAPALIAKAAAQSVTPDRISFYNVPVDDKLESHVDYADGRAEKIKYPAALCAAGSVITQPLNLYTVTFVAEGCEATVYQQINLRWLGGCLFEFENDPNARVIARGPYGETVIAEGHYPVGELELSNLPANTTSLSATMNYTNAQGNTLTGNVEFTFQEPHPGCGQAPQPTVTPTATSTVTPNITPTITPTTTMTPTIIPTTTITPTITPPVATSTATPIITPTVTPTTTALSPIDSSPTATPTPTQDVVVLPPTGLDPTDEPGVSLPWTVYLPFTAKSAGGN